MSDISQIQVNGTTYDLCDATSRTQIANLQDSVNQIGTFYGGTFSRMSINSGVNTTIREITVPAGVYVVSLYFEFKTGTEYEKRAIIHDGELIRVVQVKSDAGMGVSFTGLWKTTSQRTFTFSAMQYSGSTEELVNGMASMIRIK